jgi:hypothetical protein
MRATCPAYSIPSHLITTTKFPSSSKSRSFDWSTVADVSTHHTAFTFRVKQYFVKKTHQKVRHYALFSYLLSLPRALSVQLFRFMNWPQLQRVAEHIPKKGQADRNSTTRVYRRLSAVALISVYLPLSRNSALHRKVRAVLRHTFHSTRLDTVNFSKSVSRRHK